MTLAPSLAAASTLTLLVGLLYAWIGVHYAQRGRAHPPQAFFALFWLGIGYFGVTDGVWSMLVPLADPPLALGVTILYTKTLAGCAGFFGLVYFVAYLYRGDRRILAPIAIFYALVFLFVAYSHALAQPIGQEPQTWRSGLVYANGGSMVGTIATILLFLPPFEASIAYALLYRRTKDTAQRRRVLTTSLSLAIFFGGLLFGWLGGGAGWWPLAEKLLALATAIAVILTLGPAES